MLLKSIIHILLASCWFTTLAAGSEGISIKHAPPASPTQVQLSTYMIDVLKIVGSEQSFAADLTVQLQWHDPRLAHSENEVQVMPLQQVWNPQILIANTTAVTNTLPEVVEIQPDGTVLYRQRLIGTFTSLFDLHTFPNDHQTLVIEFVARDHTLDQVHLIENPLRTGQSERFTMTDWSIGTVRLVEQPYVIPNLEISLPSIRMELPVSRLAGYHAGTVLSSAAIIVCMAWLVFWIPPVAINPRISVSVTSMLTLIAHRYVIQGELPNLPYLTTMDYFLLGSTLVVLLGLVEVVTVFRILSNGNERKAHQYNRFFRWTYPIPFIALLALVLLG
jgi:hypothetical protein